LVTVLCIYLLMGLQNLPSGLVLRTEEELSGLSHPVSEMEWTGVVVDGAEPVTLYGTLEVSCLIYSLLSHLLSIAPLQSVFEQALKINPDFRLQEVDESDELGTRSLEERNRVCLCPRSSA